MTRTRHRQANAAFTVSREYDVLDRVTNVVYTARGGAPLRSLSYAYDPDGLVTQRVAVSASGAVTNSYAYDGLMRLVAENDSLGNSASYAYDLCGNRLSVTTPSGTASATYTHNRRDADTYDAGGRVTRTVNGRGQVLGLTWNLRGELVSVSTNGVFAEGYAYDPMGRRISTTDANGTVYHAYDGIHCVADLAPDGSLLRSYTWGSGVDIKRAQSPRRSRRATAILSPSRRDGARSGIPRRSGNCYLLAVTFYSATETNTLYAVTDPLGTVHALVGADGAVAVSYAYDSWGNPAADATSASLPNRFTWQGREYSRATGLYHFRARWYDPSTGRWLSKDPIGLEGGLNLYEAFGNNPVCFVDPDGFKLVSTDERITVALKKIEDVLVQAAKKEKPTDKKIPFTAALAAYRKLLNQVYTPINIYITSGDNKYCPSGSRENLGRGAYPIILWNPVKDESVCDANGNKKRPPYIGLAHEIGHAVSYYAYDLKLVDPDGTKYDMRNAPEGKQGKEEMAMRFENIVRSAAGLSKRIAY